MESKKQGQSNPVPKNHVHQMKIYEEFVNKEARYSNRNRTDEYTINPFTSKYFPSMDHVLT